MPVAFVEYIFESMTLHHIITFLSGLEDYWGFFKASTSICLVQGSQGLIWCLPSASYADQRLISNGIIKTEEAMNSCLATHSLERRFDARVAGLFVATFHHR